MMTPEDLSEDQRDVFDAMVAFPKTGEGLLTVGGYAGCLSGDTNLHYTRGARVGHRPITLRDLYLKFNGYRGSGRGVAQRWGDLTVPTYLLSLWPDGTAAYNRVVAVFESGTKKVVRISFDDGNHLVLTPDHPVATPDGFVAAGDFAVGDVVLGRGSLRPVDEGKGRRPLDLRPPRVIVNTKHHPGPVKIVRSNGIEYEYVRVARARLVVEASMNNLPYEEFVHALKHNAEVSAGFKYIPAEFDVHHIDEDTLNDDITNLGVLPHKEHARLHTTGRNAEVEYVREVKITHIASAGEEMTYDVQMESPANNFVANGIFVHNTGKSTVTGVFARTAQKARLLVAYIAFTGRAASVLARSLKNAGVDFTLKTRKDEEDDYLSAVAASTHFDMNLVTRDAGPAFCGTIHRLLYKPVINDRDELLGWTKRSRLDRDYDLLVVDEASMVSDEMLLDLKAHGVPIIAVGDHGQLPPVRASGALMQSPDLRLEKIHRQAEGNPIIALSRHIREGQRIDRFKSKDPRVAIRGKRDVAQVLAAVKNDPVLSVGVLCWTNKQRIELNRLSRVARGFKGAPRAGEVLMCLRNRAPVYNGMRGLLESDGVVGHQPWILNVHIGFPEEGIDPHARQLCAAQFNRVEGVFASVEELAARGIKVDTMKGAGDFFDFGYALTVHKSQGSQFAHAIVMFDMPESYSDFARWGYTAVTRGQERLTVLR